MTDRAREMARILGYDGLDALLDAIGQGEVILLKVPESQRLTASKWIRQQIPDLRWADTSLATTLDDIADGLDMALELIRYPIDSDVCDLNLPNGWPSYCDKDALSQ
jgi:hypothetical protein